MTQPAQHSSTEESNLPTRIGAGSFATVYSVRGTPFVFKVIHHAGCLEELRAEFHALHTLYTRCNSNSLFAVPRAIAFYNPTTNEVEQVPLSPPVGRVRDARPIVNSRLFTDNHFNTAAYAMDRAHVLPVQIGTRVCDLFYSTQARDQHVEPPRMCRLYFGKTIRPSQFINSMNFPIDVARYTALLNRFEADELLSLEEVVGGMGEMLSLIHWIAGYDGRDIEFVMAGTGIGVRYYVIDFNQMRRFDQQPSNIRGLVDAFFSNDPYYPRPVSSDPLYQVFRSAYLVACPEEHKAGAHTFLAAIEAEYLRPSG